MESYDCIIIGGGPVGGYIAQHIAEVGLSVGLLEEHSTIGLPVRCAGLVTKRVLDFSNSASDDSRILPITGAHIHSPSGKIYMIGGEKTNAYVINRSIFDQELVKKAYDVGADVLIGKKVVSVYKKNGLIECKYLHNQKKIRIQGRIVVGADGPYSIVRQSFNFPSPTEYVRCIGAEISNISMDPRYVEIFVNLRYAPGFFAWVIPTNNQGTTARIGLGISQKNSRMLKVYFERFLSDPLLRDIKIESYLGGTIPLGPLKKSTLAQVMLVGDAAAQVKPTSGGGLYPGLFCAKYCARVATRALKEGALDQKSLLKYHQYWTGHIGKELDRGMIYRRFFLRLTNKEISRLFKLLENNKVLDTINRYGDIDYPSRLFRPLLKSSPSLIRSIPGMLF